MFSRGRSKDELIVRWVDTTAFVRNQRASMEMRAEASSKGRVLSSGTCRCQKHFPAPGEKQRLECRTTRSARVIQLVLRYQF
jgi:hypothetical protein